MSAFAQPVQRPGLTTGAFFFASLLALAVGVLAFARAQSARPAPAQAAVTWPAGQQVAYSAHADKHPEAADIHRCLQDKGPYQTWTNGVDWFFLCQLADGRWGTLIADKEGDLFYENTAYVKGDGGWNRVIAWLRDACRATRFVSG